MKGRVVQLAGLQTMVDVEGEEWQCEVRGRFKAGRRAATSPLATGDWVDVGVTRPGAGVIERVYPRRSKVSRLASGSRPYEQVMAANLDQLVVVVAACQPALRTGFIDRAVVMALSGGVAPLVCVNKIDLDPEGRVRGVIGTYRQLGYRVLFASAETGAGVDELREVLRERVSAFVGYSGVGKSSLLNCIDARLALKTQELMERHDRGRHTTAAVRLYQLPGGGYAADTPGVKELQLCGVGRDALAGYFEEMVELLGACQFRNCTHLHEPGCAIREAVDAGRITRLRYESYRRIMEGLGAAS
jgi:ribosome biogenesis GTPase